MLLLIGYLTLFFKEEFFEVRVMTALTALLVITTMFSQVCSYRQFRNIINNFTLSIVLLETIISHLFYISGSKFITQNLILQDGGYLVILLHLLQILDNNIPHVNRRSTKKREIFRIDQPPE